MSSPAFRVAWYRFRATFGRRWRGYLALVLLVGFLGGLAMGAVAAARRTQSSFPAYLASTNPSDLTAVTAVLNPLIGSNVGYDPSPIRSIAQLPHVKRVVNASGLDVLPLAPNGAPLDFPGFPPAAGNGLGSIDGEGFAQDRVTVVQGRMSDPTRADEIVMTDQVARLVRLHVGARLSLGIYTNAQTQLPAFGTAGVTPYRRVDVTLVGIVLLGSQLIQDDTDNSSSLMLFTPAFTRPLLDCCANYTATGIRLDRGSSVASAAAAISRVLPTGFPAPAFTSLVVAKAERAIKPESIALGVFGGIAALAALLIAAQLIGRQVRLGSDDVGTLRALGAHPAMTSSDGLIGVVGAVVIGSLVALAVAVGLSTLAPIGPVRPVDASAGVSFDWTVLVVGFAVLIVGLTTLSVALSARQAPHRAAARRQRVGGRESSVARAAGRSGLPPPAVTGIHFALEPGVGRNAVPVRSAILGAALAVIVVVGTLTFGASLHALVSHPALYGWNWDYVLTAGGGSGDIPQAQATKLLNSDPYVRAWSGVYSTDLVIDGQTVPVLGEAANAAVQPPILSGHQLDAADQVVLGAVTLAQLHKRLGDTVVLSNGSAGATPLRVVGTATMPTLGAAGGPHLEMGIGALLSDDLLPAAAKNPFNDPVTGPQTILVKLRPGPNPKAALDSLQQMTTPLSTNFNFGVFVGTVLRPAEIVNYRSMSTTPALLGAALGTGAVVALALTLMAGVRRRRRDLALLKALGFTRRQLAAVVAWQSTVAVGIGIVVGVPLGIALGRSLWDVFAGEIHVVPSPTIPAVTITLIAVGGLVLANLVAAFPGRQAARTPTAFVLRAE